MLFRILKIRLDRIIWAGIHLLELITKRRLCLTRKLYIKWTWRIQRMLLKYSGSEGFYIEYLRGKIPSDIRDDLLFFSETNKKSYIPLSLEMVHRKRKIEVEYAIQNGVDF